MTLDRSPPPDPNIAPCPNCGARWCFINGRASPEKRFYVECNSCRKQGPIGETVALARTEWNALPRGPVARTGQRYTAGPFEYLTLGEPLPHGPPKDYAEDDDIGSFGPAPMIDSIILWTFVGLVFALCCAVMWVALGLVAKAMSTTLVTDLQELLR